MKLTKWKGATAWCSLLLATLGLEADVTYNGKTYIGNMYTWCADSATYHDSNILHTAVDGSNVLTYTSKQDGNSNRWQGFWRDNYNTMRYITPGSEVNYGDPATTENIGSNLDAEMQFGPIRLGGLIVETGAIGYNLNADANRAVSVGAADTAGATAYFTFFENYELSSAGTTGYIKFTTDQEWFVAPNKIVTLDAKNITIESGITVTVTGGGTLLLNNSSVINNGTIVVAANTTLQGLNVTTGNCTLSGTGIYHDLTINGGNITTNAIINLSGTTTMTSGQLELSSWVDTASTAYNIFTGTTAQEATDIAGAINSGNVTITLGNSAIADSITADTTNVVLTTSATVAPDQTWNAGTWDANTFGTASGTYYDGATNVIFTDAGTSPVTISGTVAPASIAVNSGAYVFTGGTLNETTITIASGASLDLTGTTLSGSVTIANAGSVKIDVADATKITANTSTLTLNVPTNITQNFTAPMTGTGATIEKVGAGVLTITDTSLSNPHLIITEGELKSERNGLTLAKNIHIAAGASLSQVSQYKNGFTLDASVNLTGAGTIKCYYPSYNQTDGYKPVAINCSLANFSGAIDIHSTDASTVAKRCRVTLNPPTENEVTTAVVNFLSDGTTGSQAALHLSKPITLGGLNGPYGGELTGATTALTVNVSENTTYSFNGLVSGSVSELIKSGLGTQTLGGNNNTDRPYVDAGGKNQEIVPFTGGIDLQSGVLGLDHAEALGTGNVTITFGTIVNKASTASGLLKFGTGITPANPVQYLLTDADAANLNDGSITTATLLTNDSNYPGDANIQFANQGTVLDLQITYNGNGIYDISTLTPVIGLQIEQTQNLLTWMVQQEIGVVSYQVEQFIHGQWQLVEAFAAGESQYQATIDSAYDVRLVVIDQSGFVQSFLPDLNGKARTAYTLTEGWNLLSMPLADADLSTLYQSIDSPIYVWDGANYVITETLVPGQGFFVYSATSTDVIVAGTAIDFQPTLVSGWNLVGFAENSEKPAAAQIIYTGSTYQEVLNQDVLVAGAGYWIFVD